MSKYVPDISTHRWVIISPQRVKRTKEGKKDPKRKQCVFGQGNEDLTTPEVFRIGSGPVNKPGWQVRVIPNKYPITDIHEVIIHSPDCENSFQHLSHEQLTKVFYAYRQRYNEYRQKGQVLIFCNYGEHAGASIPHPHSQLVVLPKQINLDTLLREPIQNVVSETKFFNVYCPDFSQWPYETWIAPKVQGSYFGDIKDEEINELTKLLQKLIRKMKRLVGTKKFFVHKEEFDFNYYIYPRENWYLRLIPRFVHRAGFELGTGLSVNIVDPMTAAEELKE